MLNKSVIATFLVFSVLLAGCSAIQNTKTDTEVTGSSETSIVIPLPDDDDQRQTEPSEPSETSKPTTPDEGAQYISTAIAEGIDKVQGGGYIPKTPDQFPDPLLREYATKFYNEGYDDLIDMDYMGKCQAGFGLIHDTLEYFNTGVDACKVVSLGEDMGDKVLERCVIRMTEDQYVNIMLHGCGIEYYFSEMQKDEWPEETDDGIVRHTESVNGNYIEYNRENGVCILYVDHSLVNIGETYYDDDE